VNCAYPGCYNLPRPDCEFCSRSCAMKMQRAKQPMPRRIAIAKLARAAQGRDVIERLLARVKTFAHGEDNRIIFAWRLGKASRKSREYRQRQRSAAA
jgi:biotin synthase-like enzyme